MVTSVPESRDALETKGKLESEDWGANYTLECKHTDPGQRLIGSSTPPPGGSRIWSRSLSTSQEQSLPPVRPNPAGKTESGGNVT